MPATGATAPTPRPGVRGAASVRFVGRSGDLALGRHGRLVRPAEAGLQSGDVDPGLPAVGQVLPADGEQPQPLGLAEAAPHAVRLADRRGRARRTRRAPGRRGRRPWRRTRGAAGTSRARRRGGRTGRCPGPGRHRAAASPRDRRWVRAVYVRSTSAPLLPRGTAENPCGRRPGGGPRRRTVSGLDVPVPGLSPAHTSVIENLRTTRAAYAPSVGKVRRIARNLLPSRPASWSARWRRGDHSAYRSRVRSDTTRGPAPDLRGGAARAVRGRPDRRLRSRGDAAARRASGRRRAGRHRPHPAGQRRLRPPGAGPRAAGRGAAARHRGVGGGRGHHQRRRPGADPERRPRPDQRGGEGAAAARRARPGRPAAGSPIRPGTPRRSAVRRRSVAAVAPVEPGWAATAGRRAGRRADVVPVQRGDDEAEARRPASRRRRADAGPARARRRTRRARSG